MIAYKLCSTRSKLDGELFDREFCSFNDTRSEFTVVYQIGEWTYPKLARSLLFVFDTLENALEYAKDFPYSTLFECEVGDVFRQKIPTADTWDIREYWENNVNNEPVYISGCYATNKVKLLKMVEHEKC